MDNLINSELIALETILSAKEQTAIFVKQDLENEKIIVSDLWNHEKLINCKGNSVSATIEDILLQCCKYRFLERQ